MGGGTVQSMATQARLESAPYELVFGDSLKWLERRDANSIHAIVTDPPYGIREFDPAQVDKMRNGNGGVWRVHMKIGGNERKLLPRFTDLSPAQREAMSPFFRELGRLFEKVIVPGGHVVIASSPLLSHYVTHSFEAEGLEVRGSIIRVIRTLRGGFKPKGSEEDFPLVSSMPRGCWEPWLLFRKPLEGTLAENLRKYGTGGLRRFSKDRPMMDVISCGLASKEERKIAPHPTLKPQALMRLLVRAATPMEKGVVLDPFMGGGSVIAACVNQGLKGIGIEADEKFYAVAEKAIPKLAQVEATIPMAWDEVKAAVNGHGTGRLG